MWQLLLLFSLLVSSCMKPGSGHQVFHIQTNKKQQWLAQQHMRGYLEAACTDSVRIRGIWQHRCTRGIGYTSDSIFIQGASELVCWQTYPAQFRAGMSLQEIDLLCKNAVQAANNAGYPFAQVLRTIRQPQCGAYQLHVNFRPGAQFFWDSIIFAGTPAPDGVWLMRALGLSPGSIWKPIAPETIRARLDMTAPYRWTGQPMLMYAGTKAGVYLPAAPIAANQLLLLAGIGNRAGSNKPIITGEARLHLEHLFSRAWMVHAAWRNFNGMSQDMHLELRAPFPAGLPVTAGLSFRAARMDSSFATVNPAIRAGWMWRKLELQAGYEQQNHIQQNIDSQFIVKNRALPDNLGCRVQLYQLGLQYRNLDHPINPGKGWAMELNVATGTKSIKRNPAIEQLPLNIYDSLARAGALNSNPWRIQGKLQGVVKLRGAFRLMAGIEGQWLQDEISSVAQATRLGGFSNLRGFNEQRIFASSWLMSTIELRYLLTERTHAGLFWNGAQTWLNTAVVRNQERRFHGFGCSIGFETKPGILQIIWALGQESGNPLSWRESKIHAGLISHF